MASVPSASWNSRSITHLANYLSRNLPMNSSDESRFLTIRAEGCTLTTQIINQIRRQITDPETLHFDSRVRRQTSRTVYQAGFVVSRHVNYRRGVFPALMGYISDF